MNFWKLLSFKHVNVILTSIKLRCRQNDNYYFDVNFVKLLMFWCQNDVHVLDESNLKPQIIGKLAEKVKIVFLPLYNFFQDQ